MCGIIGCTARRNVADLIIDGLRQLEYRGYDSAGMAVIRDGKLVVVRREGRIDNLASEVQSSGVDGFTGIGHTRWATHGAPSEINAHPHVDGAGNLAVIHNGIIENHEILRERLKAKGHVFYSETDSEVFPHLVQEQLKTHDLFDAVRLAIAEVRGTYSFVVIDRTQPHRMIGARRDSPLIVGLGKGENYVASDVSALLALTRDVVYLGNGDVVEVTPDHVRIVDEHGNAKALVKSRVEWDAEAAAKGGYRHYMLKEIDEQPAVVAKTLQRHLDESSAKARFVLPDAKALEPFLADVERISITACGTSWHAGLVGKFLIEKRAGVPVEVDYASEFRYRDAVLAKNHLVLAISQSGETLDTLAAIRDARARGAKVLSIVNVQGSSLVRDSDGVMLTDAGPEIGVASTKAFTTQLVALQVLSWVIARARGRLDRDREAKAVEDLRVLRFKLDESLAKTEEIARAAEMFSRAQDFLFLGRGVNYPVALEGALKLKEISYIHAEGYPAGEMKHGPIALIDANMPIVVVATPGKVHEKVLSNMQEVKARGGRIIAVAAHDDAAVKKLADIVLPVPIVDEDLSPIVNVVPLQRLAYWIADLRGCDIDKPRNLAKSVTVE